MKMRPLIGHAVLVIAMLWGFAVSAVPASEAVEAHHRKSTEGEKAPSGESTGKETTPGAAEGGSRMMGKMHGSGKDGDPGMMGKMHGSGKDGDPGMMGKMHGSGKDGDPGMMGMMEKGMMHMMMSHMTGGQAGGMGKMMGRMGSRMKDGGVLPVLPKMVHMLDELDLTQGQWDEVRSLARDRLEKMVDLWAQRMKLRIELAAIRWDQEVDPQKVKDLFIGNAEAKAELFLVGLDYLRSLKNILTPEQLQELESQGL